MTTPTHEQLQELADRAAYKLGRRYRVDAEPAWKYRVLDITPPADPRAVRVHEAISPSLEPAPLAAWLSAYALGIDAGTQHTAERIRAERQYNGWTNYETWAVNLWMDNEQGSHEEALEMARDAYREATPSEFCTRKQEAMTELERRYKDLHEERSPLTDEDGTTTEATVYHDLLGAALDEVNWREIAEAKLDAVIEEIDREEQEQQAEALADERHDAAEEAFEHGENRPHLYAGIDPESIDADRWTQTGDTWSLPFRYRKAADPASAPKHRATFNVRFEPETATVAAATWTETEEPAR